MFAMNIAVLVLCTQPITPLRTYNSVKNGIMVEVVLPEGADLGHLALLDHQGVELATPAAVLEGPHDLVRRIPEILTAPHAVWVQLIVDGTQVGSPLVVQPMLSRDVPITEEAQRPDSSLTYTKIVGWKNESEEDGLEEPFLSGWRVYADMDALVETSEGNIRIALRPDVAPNTVWNFRELAKGGFYRGTSFHRIVPLGSKGHPFVIQGGDPTGTGFGGPGWWLPIERSELPHDFGVISMARASHPDSAGSQFFLCLSRAGTALLDGQYCAFGETIEGSDVIHAIAKSPLADPSMGEPVLPLAILNIRLVPTNN